MIIDCHSWYVCMSVHMHYVMYVCMHACVHIIRQSMYLFFRGCVDMDDDILSTTDICWQTICMCTCMFIVCYYHTQALNSDCCTSALFICMHTANVAGYPVLLCDIDMVWLCGY